MRPGSTPRRQLTDPNEALLPATLSVGIARALARHCPSTKSSLPGLTPPPSKRPPAPVSGAQLSNATQLRLALSVGRTFACLAALPGGRYGYVLDNARKQYGVDGGDAVWLIDYDGLQLLPRGQRLDGVPACWEGSDGRGG